MLLGFATVVVWPAAMGAGGMAARATLAVALALLLLGAAGCFVFSRKKA